MSLSLAADAPQGDPEKHWLLQELGGWGLVPLNSSPWSRGPQKVENRTRTTSVGERRGLRRKAGVSWTWPRNSGNVSTSLGWGPRWSVGLGPEPALPLSLHLYPLSLQRLRSPRLGARRLSQAPLHPPSPTYPGKETLIWTSHRTRTDRSTLETDTQIHGDKADPQAGRPRDPRTSPEATGTSADR